ncbi:hypothetical protein E6H14_02200 [Candidatus Bathyarchaeota archaeon]|nr:MAG: hypothetical protein E6H14_02200 [Candidatus Bathyarchaeota archaeon]
MKDISIIKLTLVFAVVFSFASLPGALSSNVHLPSVQLAHAATAPNVPWIPAGPAFDTLVSTIYADQNAEFTQMQAGLVDVSDWPLTPALITSLGGNNGFFVTPQIASHDYDELEFHNGNNFWGCDFSFTNSACGIDIRQGIAHLLDKNILTTTQADIAGVSLPIDNALPPSLGLPTPNPCAWDALFPQSGPACVVGAAGGLAYHLAAATAGVGPSHPTFAWTPGLGTPDFCAAADHFIHANLATGKNPTTCVLTGISGAVSAHVVNMYTRIDDPPRYQGGLSIAEAQCALFTGTFSQGCAGFVSVTQGPITGFTGFTTSPTGVNQNWNEYTAGYGSVFPFDALYFQHHGQFVSGVPSIQPPNGPCSSLAVPSFSAGNYMYICDTVGDTFGQQLEFASCVSAPGDPTPGQVTPTFANCPGTTTPSSTSAGYRAEDRAGSRAYTIPWFSPKAQYGYLSNWQGVVNHQGNGIPTFYTWLSAYSPNPAQAGTIRQGFKETTRSLNPYIASTIWDFFMIGNVYDSINAINPLSNSQLLEWMTVNSLQLDNSALGYTPPAGTVSTFRFTLRNDMYWQDGRKVTSYDVKFSYRTLKDTGSFQGSGLAPMVDVTVLSLTQFDINLNAVGPFTKLTLTGPTIIPGRYWSGTCAGAAWDNDIAAGSVPNSCMTADNAKIQPGYDPLLNGLVIGSSAWVCQSSTGVRGVGCDSKADGTQNPDIGGSYTLARYGLGHAPGSSLTDSYFHSNGALALWAWSGNNGDFTHDFINFSVVARCVGQAVTGGSTGCGHWQQGIGGDVNGAATKVDVPQIGIVSRFVGVNWVQPFAWPTTPPTGIASFPPTLHEGSATLTPASTAGCGSAYPLGGYDC